MNKGKIDFQNQADKYSQKCFLMLDLDKDLKTKPLHIKIWLNIAQIGKVSRT